MLLFNIFAAPRLLYRHKGLFRQMLQRNISTRYRGSVLGLIWSFAYPLMMLAVYTFVFGIIFKARWGVETLDENRAAFHSDHVLRPCSVQSLFKASMPAAVLL